MNSQETHTHSRNTPEGKHQKKLKYFFFFLYFSFHEEGSDSKAKKAVS